MQPLSWYVNRLRSMNADEVWWRVRSTARDALDRYRIPAGRVPTLTDAIEPGHRVDDPPTFRVSDLAVAAWRDPAGADERAWVARLREQADALEKHEFSFFNKHRVFMGEPVRWNFEVNVAKPTPTGLSVGIDYRDHRVTGDCKFAWEPNRHHQLVVLGRAYRATGEQRYAAAVVEQLQSWLDQCPFGYGMNWRSPLELGVRLINWVWALDLIRESGVVTPALHQRLVHAVYLHVWEIARKRSHGSSSNNHLTGELAGIYVATTYFGQLRGRDELRREAARGLQEQLKQLLPADGGWGEHAVGYQLFVLQFLLAVGITARSVGDDFPADYWAGVERMLEFVATLTEGGPIPKFGDADDGYVLDLGLPGADARGLLAVGAVLFGNGRLKAAAERFQEPARWWLGAAASSRFAALPEPASSRIASHPFSDSGYYLLQAGQRGSLDRISVFFDCAELGFGAIAAHGHADALSVALRAFGQDVLIDPGTYDYFTFPEWRRYFRSTRAHNTIGVDGQDQSQMLGPFLWGARASATLLTWEPRPNGGVVAGSQDGYSRLPDPVRHHRRVELDADRRSVFITDTLECRSRHDIEVNFHVAPGVRVDAPVGSRVTLHLREGAVGVVLDPSLSVRLVTGSKSPILGWASHGYHQIQEATTIVASGRIEGTASLVCRIDIGSPATA